MSNVSRVTPDHFPTADGKRYAVAPSAERRRSMAVVVYGAVAAGGALVGAAVMGLVWWLT